MESQSINPMDEERFSEKRIQELIQHGKKNHRTSRLISNWCRNARVRRSPGRGLIEEAYNVPIGHMGVGCNYAPPDGIMCWDLEDAFLEHYERNCISCNMRQVGKGQNIQPIIDKFEARKAKFQAREEAQKKQAMEELEIRRRERKEVFDPTIPTGIEIRELIDSIDSSEDQESEYKLIELARLAPDAFTPSIINYLECQVLSRQQRLDRVFADILVILPIEEERKLRIALSICDYNVSEVVYNFLERNVSNIPPSKLDKVIGPFTFLAAPTSNPFGGSIVYNPIPLHSLVKAHTDSIGKILNHLLKNNLKHEIDQAARIISTITPKFPDFTAKYRRAIFAKLLRRNFLLPELEEHGSGDTLQYLRKAATALFEVDSDACDAILSALCTGGNITASKETAEIYIYTLRHNRNEILSRATPAHYLAFSKLIWMAVENSSQATYHPATHFFNHVNESLVEIAVSQMDVLYGAATLLSQKANQIGNEKSVHIVPNELEKIEQSNERNSIFQLQRSLIRWSFFASKHHGVSGIKSMINLYVNTPESDLHFRANLVEELASLIVNTEALNIILPHLYAAMTHPEPLIRGSAAAAIGKIPYDVLRDFPDLFFEVHLTLISDPNVYVHRSALNALNVDAFPESKIQILKYRVLHLIQVYRNVPDGADFLVQCLECFVKKFLSDSELMRGNGKLVVEIIDSLPNRSACDAIEKLMHKLRHEPDFAKVVSKQLGSDYGLEYDCDILNRALFQVPVTSLTNCVEDIYKFGKSMAFSNQYRVHTSVTLLSRAGAYDTAEQLCIDLLKAIPNTQEQLELRAFIESLRRISRFESVLPQSSKALRQEQIDWDEHCKVVSKTRKEADASRRRIPSVLFR